MSSKLSTANDAMDAKLALQLELKREMHKTIVRSHNVPSCLNCSSWQEREGLPTGCILFKELPPPHIIVYACPEHNFDIPF